MSQNEDSQRQEKRQGNTWLEWLASGVGLILAVGSIGYVLWNGMTAADQPPEVQVAVQRVVERQPGYTVEILATNPTESTAATVLVEGELKRNGQTVETSETTFDFVPGRSERPGGLYFSNDPRQFDLAVRAKGYIEP